MNESPFTTAWSRACVIKNRAHENGSRVLTILGSLAVDIFAVGGDLEVAVGRINCTQLASASRVSMSRICSACRSGRSLPRYTGSFAIVSVQLVFSGARRKSSTVCVQLPRYTDTPIVDSAFIQQKYDGGGLLLQYSMSSLNRDKNIRYPLARLAHDRQDLYYALRFWLSPDFVYVTSETLEGFANTECQCGASLIHEKHRDVFYPNAHFPLRCPECNNPFDPNARLFHLRCAFTGDSSTVVGGTTFRFCVEIDCGKCIPRDDVSFHPDLHRLCSNVLGCEFY